MQRRGRSVFLYVRLLLVAFGFVSAAIGAASRDDWMNRDPAIGFGIVPIVFAFMIVGLLFVIGMQAVNPWSAKVWNKPSWAANPFSFSQPCQFFHLAAWFFMASGVGALIGRVLAHRALDVGVPLLFAMGLGGRVGLVLVEFVFRGKFVNHAS